MTDAAKRLESVRQAIAAAEREAGRPAGAVTLIAVSKTFGTAAIEPVISAGQIDFGENRVQEAQGKWPDLRAARPDLVVHLIGPLQSNKAKDAVALFDVIHTIDRDKIAGAIAAEMEKQGRTPQLLVQVNTGAEPQKAGIDPRRAEDFVRRCREVHGLAIVGLMCIPPVEDVPGPHFALLRKLAAACNVEQLSMGMSADFKSAIAHGATHVRIGSAIFGARTPPPPASSA